MELDLQTLGKVYNTDICMDDKHFWEKMADMLLNGVMKAEPIRDAFISLDQFATDESIGITKSLFNYYAARFLNPLSATGLQPYEVREGIYEGCQDIAVDSVIRNADEFREKLKREMISQLNLFLKEFETVFDDQGSERYLVDTTEQMKAELFNFLRVFGKIYERPWFQVFSALYDQEVILKEERGLLKELSLKEQQIKEYLDNFQ